MSNAASRRRNLKNVTITLDEVLLKQARIQAALEEKSLSALLADILRERLVGAGEYRRAMAAFLKQEPVLDTGGKALPSRDELYDRGLLR